MFTPPPRPIEADKPSVKGKRQHDNVLAVYGDLLRDSETLNEKLVRLLADPDAFHGNLQATLSLLRTMQGGVQLLIDHVEVK